MLAYSSTQPQFGGRLQVIHKLVGGVACQGVAYHDHASQGVAYLGVEHQSETSVLGVASQGGT